MKIKSLRDQINEYLEGKYDSSNIHIQCEAGWYDWFCKDSLLSTKTNKLYQMVLSICKSKKINLDTMHISFKNNCPIDGELYDNIMFFNEDFDIIYVVTPKSGHRIHNGNGEIWGKENNFKEVIFQGTWKEIKEWFLK